MAGIGVKLNKIYSKNTIATNLFGAGYSTMITVAPMFLVIIAVLLMQYLLGFSKISYATRELYSCTVLYIFIFGLLTASPFNAVLSKYLSDIIYEEKYADILPCFYVGLFMNTILSVLLGIPFCVHEYIVGKVDIFFVFAGFCGYMALMFVFYSMLYMSICKVYKNISFYFLLGMVVTVLLSLVLVYLFHVSVTFAMLVSLDVGFLLIGSLEYALIQSYFRENSGNYKKVFTYFKKYWQLVLTNFLYTLGLYLHNFFFWSSDLQLIVVKSFVCAPVYDMATCIAMFTNISASVIFIARVEMRFHERYKNYSEAVIGGRGMDIYNAKKRMFEQLTDELMNLVRIQFIISVVVFFMAMIILPQFGMGGMVMQIYPCLAAGYFILFTMYAAIIFLYYFNDLNGALLTALSFAVVTAVTSFFALKFPVIWYGTGLVVGSLAGWAVAYLRLRHMEANLDVHIFCQGSLLKKAEGRRPEGKVFDRNAAPAQAQKTN